MTIRITLDLGLLDTRGEDPAAYTVGMVIGLLRGAGITVAGYVVDDVDVVVDVAEDLTVVAQVLDDYGTDVAQVEAEQVPEADRPAFVAMRSPERPYDLVDDRPRFDPDAARARAGAAL